MMALKRWISKIRYGAPLILVSGLPRSGTSMLMKMLNEGGLEIATDSIRRADEDNPKGYFELERVKDLDKEQDKSWLGQYKGKVVKIISFLLPHLPGDLNYRVIFIDRNIEEVIASQNKMLTNRNETGGPADDAKMAKNYEMHLRKVKYLLGHSPNIETLYVNHRDIVENPNPQVDRINRFLGGNLDVEKMRQAVDPALYRNRR